MEGLKSKLKFISPCVRRAVCELSEGGNGEQWRVGTVGMTYADMHEGLAHFDGAQRSFFEASKRLLKASVWLNETVPIFHREECNEWTHLQTNDKLQLEARMLMAFADWKRDERKT